MRRLPLQYLNATNAVTQTKTIKPEKIAIRAIEIVCNKDNIGKKNLNSHIDYSPKFHSHEAKYSFVHQTKE